MGSRIHELRQSPRWPARDSVGGHIDAVLPIWWGAADDEGIPTTRSVLLTGADLTPAASPLSRAARASGWRRRGWSIYGAAEAARALSEDIERLAARVSAGQLEMKPE